MGDDYMGSSGDGFFWSSAQDWMGFAKISYIRDSQSIELALCRWSSTLNRVKVPVRRSYVDLVTLSVGVSRDLRRLPFPPSDLPINTPWAQLFVISVDLTARLRLLADTRTGQTERDQSAGIGHGLLLEVLGSVNEMEVVIVSHVRDSVRALNDESAGFKTW